MDPLTVGAAFAMAQASVKTVKEAIKLGKDVFEVSGDLTNFFAAQSKIKHELKKAEETKQELLKQNKHEDYYALTAKALDAVVKAKKIRDDEAEIKTWLIWSGNGDIYQAMVKERLRLEKEQALAENRELFERAMREKKKQEMKALQHDLSLVIGSVLVLILTFTMIVQWGIDNGLWTSGYNDARLIYQTQRIK